MAPLRIAFFGTPEFAVPSLRALVSRGHVISGVITQPDRPRGRGQKLSPSPVKACAESYGLPVLQPDRLKDEAFLSVFSALESDLAVVAAYGKILPSALLAMPRLGFINVHASLLPRWRGASPIHRAVMAGDAETGISIMRVVLALDAGGVFSKAIRPIGPDETAEEVERDLAELGGTILVPVIDALDTGAAQETPQDEALVTYAPRLLKDDGVIYWSVPAMALHNQVRGLYPWPHAHTTLNGARVIVLRTKPGGLRPPSAAVPGEILEVRSDAIVAATGADQSIELILLQAEGRRPVSAREFAAGARLAPSARFGA
jgi:methionyl-tRNA formyltransferase